MSDSTSSSIQGPAGFLTTALARIKSNLELFVGKAIGVAHADPAAASGAELADRLPARGIVLGVKVSGAVEGELHCVASVPMMLALASHAKNQTDAQIAERLSGPSEMTDPERDGVKEVGSFVTAALGDFAKEATGGRIVLAPMDARFATRGGDAPWSVTEQGFALEATLEIGGAPPSLLVLFAPSTVVAAWSGPDQGSGFGASAARPKTTAPRAAPAASPEPAAPAGPAAQPASAHPRPPTKATTAAAGAPGAPARTTTAAWAAGRSSFAKAVQAACARVLAVTAMPSLVEVIAAANSGPGPAVLVIEVPEGEEFELDVIAALRRNPGFADTRVVVALEAPSRATVLRCGTLGILDVVPADLDAKALGERLIAAATRGRSPSRTG